MSKSSIVAAFAPCSSYMGVMYLGGTIIPTFLHFSFQYFSRSHVLSWWVSFSPQRDFFQEAKPWQNGFG
jgi:hypothetical protein